MFTQKDFQSTHYTNLLKLSFISKVQMCPIVTVQQVRLKGIY